MFNNKKIIDMKQIIVLIITALVILGVTVLRVQNLVNPMFYFYVIVTTLMLAMMTYMTVKDEKG